MITTVAALFALAILACNNPAPKTGGGGTLSPATDSLVNSGGHSADEAVRDGAVLITRADCFTCHAIEKKVVGPSYKDIARKYQPLEGNVDKLTTAIIRGSRGIWGDAAMTPHPNISHEDARKMVNYIFSLRDNLPVQDTVRIKQ
ncbi:c-type cytochrome [Deminuibacter soli]|nr:c-type cytochrome [Deminuibacter soli]